MKLRRILNFSNLLIFLGIIFLALSFGPILKDEIWYNFLQIKNQKYILNNVADSYSVFGQLLGSKPILVTPVNTDFSLVIEKIGLNVPVVADVSVNDENLYRDALKTGVAHAMMSPYPSSNAGNVYIFAHSSLNFWELGKYSSVFNLLRKLDINDPIHVFFRGDDYIYKVINKEIVKGWNTNPITRATIEPILTLQTCDPPGTTLNRLVVTAKLSEVRSNK